jgi:hypothetical protein
MRSDGAIRELPISRILSRTRKSGDDHSSRRGITDALQQPTRRFRRHLPKQMATRLSAPDRHATAAWAKPRIPSLFGLAPCGVYPAFDLTAEAVRSYRTFSPLPEVRISPKLRERRDCGRYLLCGTGRLQALKPESRTLSGTLSCGVRTFLPRKCQCTPAAIV